jgi:putative dimethyl sulfoxide reductase chaperone
MELLEKIQTANCYKFLAECFYYPEVNQVKSIKKYAEYIPEYLSDIVSNIGSIKDIQIDFSKLFIGPFKVLASPYGSVYLEEGKTTFGNSTIDVIDRYQEEDLKVDLKEPSDHIAIELEFMYYLITTEIDAINNGDFKKANSYRNKQQSFLNGHLSLWVSEFTDSIIKNAKSDFYKKIAISLNLMIKEEHSLIN